MSKLDKAHQSFKGPQSSGRFPRTIDAIAGVFKRWKKEKAQELREEVDLPSKDGEKVVISRSNGDLVAGIIVGIVDGKYEVAYQVGDSVHFKGLSKDEVENNQKMFDSEKFKNSVECIKDGTDVDDYRFGDEVMIPRTNAQPSKAYIVGYIPEGGLYPVGFIKKEKMPGVKRHIGGGKYVDYYTECPAYKVLNKEDLDAYNK